MRLRLAYRHASIRLRSGMNCPQTVKASFMQACRASCAPAVAATGARVRVKSPSASVVIFIAPSCCDVVGVALSPAPVGRITYQTAIATALTPGLGFVLHLSEIETAYV